MVIRVPNLHMPQALTHSFNVHFLTTRKFQCIQCLLTITFVYQGNGTEENVFENQKVFKEDLKELTEVEWRTETGSWFQAVGAW